MPRHTVEQYVYSVDVYIDDDGTELARYERMDDTWYDTLSDEEISQEELDDNA